jgi:aspartate aminotransferase-like enzyme
MGDFISKMGGGSKVRGEGWRIGKLGKMRSKDSALIWFE